MSFDMIADVLIDSAHDVAKMLPMLYVILVAADLIVTRMRSVRAVDSTLGTAAGALFGLIPQCGVPVGAAELFCKRQIGLGVLFAIFLASSDEALIIAGAHLEGAFIAALAGTKIAIGIIAGLAIRTITRRSATDSPWSIDISDDCCAPKTSVGGAFVRNAKGLVMIALYIWLSVAVLGLIAESADEAALEAFAGRGLYIQPVLAALIGFVPTCASSIFVTEAYLEGLISFGAMTAGLCANTGFGILVIWRRLSPARALALSAGLIGASVAAGEIITFVSSILEV